jgi:DNA-binding beta-propeller fold protein YncE
MGISGCFASIKRCSESALKQLFLNLVAPPEVKVNRSRALLLCSILCILTVCAQAAEQPPLKLVHTIPLPQLHEGDFDHFTVDIAGDRLFSTAEENSKVLVFDLKTNKLIHTMDDLKAPHSMLYRGDLRKLFVVDGDLGQVKIYDTDSYKPTGAIKVREGADSSAYDPSTKLLYVVDVGKDAKLPDSYITIIDTDAAKVAGEIKIDCDDVEAVAIEKSGPRLFVNLRANSSVQVYDRTKRTLIATWSVAETAKKPTPLAFDESNHRLFAGTRDPSKLVVLDSDSGKIVASAPAAAMPDDLAFDPDQKRIYFAGSMFIDVFQQKDADHYDHVAQIPTAFRAKTGLLVPQQHRYYLAVPRHEKRSAEIRIYEVQ